VTQSFYERFGKRWLDAVCSLAALILLSPVLLLVAAAVKLTSPGSALFQQIRTSQFDKRFRILKFRTMTTSTTSSDSLLTAAGDPRITPLGQWLRKLKIDELPQLINVLRGEMSLVGPRPEVPFYTAKYSESQKRVLFAKPGITGTSIIMNEEELMAGQSEKESFYISTVMPAKLEIDLAYCSDIRFLKDLALLRSTIARLFLRSFGESGAPEDGTPRHLAADRMVVRHKRSVLHE